MEKMTYKDLFLYLKKKNDYTTTGIDVQYNVTVDHEEKIVFLFFEESTTKTDWKTNLNWPAKVYKHQEYKMLVHRGFVKAWKSCNDEVMTKFIAEVDKTGYKPFICGWSFGGAMSLLAAEDFNYRTGMKARVITYGAPKICFFYKTWKHFVEATGFITQFVRINDLVTWCVPLPFVRHVNKTKLKEKFSFKLLFNPEKVHPHYEELL